MTLSAGSQIGDLARIGAGASSSLMCRRLDTQSAFPRVANCPGTCAQSKESWVGKGSVRDLPPSIRIPLRNGGHRYRLPHHTDAKDCFARQATILIRNLHQLARRATHQNLSQSSAPKIFRLTCRTNHRITPLVSRG